MIELEELRSLLLCPKEVVHEEDKRGARPVTGNHQPQPAHASHAAPLTQVSTRQVELVTHQDDQADAQNI